MCLSGCSDVPGQQLSVVMVRVPKIPDPPARPEGFWQYPPARYPKHICKYPARPARQKRIPARIPGGIFWQWNSRGIPQNFKIYSIKFAKNIPQFFCCPPNFLVVPNYCIFRGTILGFDWKATTLGCKLCIYDTIKWWKLPGTRPEIKSEIPDPPGKKIWNTRPARYPEISKNEIPDPLDTREITTRTITRKNES